MNIENPQEDGRRSGGRVIEMTVVPSIPQGIYLHSYRIQMCLLKDCENLNGNHVR